MNFKALLLAAHAAAAVAGCASPSTIPKSPIVLVHGAWSESRAWDRVADELRARGHAVVAVNLPGHGPDATSPKDLSLTGYADAVFKALPVDGRALLVGHSMAGMVISMVAERAPERVSKLVYVAAYLPRNGESLYQLSMQDKDSDVGKFWRQDDPKTYSPATIAREGLIATFCAECNPADQRYLLESHKPEAVPPLATPVILSAERFGRVPRAYVHTRDDRAVSLGLQQQMVTASGGANPVITLASGHMPMLTQSKACADAIVAATR